MIDSEPKVPQDFFFGIRSIKWSPNGRYIASIISPISMEPEFQGNKLLLADKDTLNFAVLHADGWPRSQEWTSALIAWSSNNLLWATFNNSVRVYSPEGGFTEFVLSDLPPYRLPYRMTVASDHTQLALLTHDRGMRNEQRLTVYELENHKPCFYLDEELPYWVSWIEFSRDGTLLAIMGRDSVQVLKRDQNNYRYVKQLQFSRLMDRAAWSWDGRLLACAGTPTSVFRVSDWKVVATFDDKPIGAGLFCFTPDDHWLIRGGTAYHLYDNRRHIITEREADEGDLSQQGLAALGISRRDDQVVADWIRNQNFGSFFRIFPVNLVNLD